MCVRGKVRERRHTHGTRTGAVRTTRSSAARGTAPTVYGISIYRTDTRHAATRPPCTCHLRSVPTHRQMQMWMQIQMYVDVDRSAEVQPQRHKVSAHPSRFTSSIDDRSTRSPDAGLVSPPRSHSDPCLSHMSERHKTASFAFHCEYNSSMKHTNTTRIPRVTGCAPCICCPQ